MRRRLELAALQRRILAAASPVPRVDHRDLPARKEGQLFLEQGEAFQQGKRIGRAVQLDEKGVAPARLGGEGELHEILEAVAAGAARRNGSDRGRVGRQGRGIDLGVFEIVEDHVAGSPEFLGFG